MADGQLMPTPLVILFWIWLLVSVCIYLSRFFKRMSGGAASEETEVDEREKDELPLDSPDRWNSAEQADDVSLEAQPSPEPAVAQPGVAEPLVTEPAATEPAVTAALAEQALEEPDASFPPEDSSKEGLPVSKLASRLEPLVDESHIEPSVLSAMSPTQRAALGTTAAASGGLFDPQVRATMLDDVEYDHRPLTEILAGIALPCDLVPAFRAASNEHYAIFTTATAGAGEVAAKVAAELERLGFEVTPKPPSGARAIRETSAVDVVVSFIEESDDGAPHVELEFTSL